MKKRKGEVFESTKIDDATTFLIHKPAAVPDFR